MADGSGYEFGDAPGPEELAAFELNDIGNAKRLIRMVGGQFDALGDVDLGGAILLYQREVGWVGWNGKTWDLKLGQRLAERTAHRVVHELVGQRIHMEDRGHDKKAVTAFVRESGNAGRISSMLKVAEAYLQVDLEVFDTAELALTAEALYTCVYTKSGFWIVTGLTKLGAAQACKELSLVPDQKD